MESEKYICVRDATTNDKTVTIVDLQNPSNVLKRPTAADAALMNPSQNILALKGELNELFYAVYVRFPDLLVQMHSSCKYMISQRKLS